MLKRAVIIVWVWLMLTALLMPAHTRLYRFPQLAYFPQMPVATANPVTEEGVALGRYLFYDPILSVDSTMSCSTCHRQAAAFSDGPNAFSKDRAGGRLYRNTPPLFNLAWNTGLFWDGRAGSIEEQVLHPVRDHNEMNLQWTAAIIRINRSPFYRPLFHRAFGEAVIDSNLIAKAIAQFERTLLSYRSKYDRVLAGKDRFTEDEYDGFDIINDMSKGDCLHCHVTDAGALGMVPSFSNNGLDGVLKPEDYKDAGRGKVTGNTHDYGKFKVPSLRNVALTSPYMHDGRFKTLEEVIDFYSDSVKMSPTVDSKMGSAIHGGVHLSAVDKRKVVAFLRTLTDSAFIYDPLLKNPFIEQRHAWR